LPCALVVDRDLESRRHQRLGTEGLHQEGSWQATDCISENCRERSFYTNVTGQQCRLILSDLILRFSRNRECRMIHTEQERGRAKVSRSCVKRLTMPCRGESRGSGK